MKRIKDIKDIPVFLSNQRYDGFYQNMSKKRLKKEVRKRHKLFERLQHVLNDTYIIEDDFVQDKKKSTRLNKKNSNKNTVVVKITNTINGVKQILPPKTKSELIQDEKNSIIRAISGFTEPLYIDGKNGKILNYHSSDFTILPGFNFDNSPIIIPIMSCDNYQNLKNGNKFCESEPQNLEDYTKLPSIFLNLDFSDDVIIEELRNYLTLLRKQKNHQPTYLQTRAYLEKLKNYRILQVMDIIMWQYATDYHIQYDTLAMFLSGHRKDMYSGKRLKETIIPLAKNLLNSKSNEFGFFYYLVNKNDEV